MGKKTFWWYTSDSLFTETLCKCFTRARTKIETGRERHRQSAEVRETSVFGLVFLFEQRDDALDDAKLFYLFVVVVPK